MSGVFCIFVLTVTSWAAAPASQLSWIDEAKAVIKSHEAFARSGDLDGIMSNIADDVVLIAPGTPLVQGKTAMRELYAGFLKGGTFDMGHDYAGAEVVANIVVLHGVARGKFVPGSGEPAPFANNFLLILKRQPNGRFQVWRIAFGPSGS